MVRGKSYRDWVVDLGMVQGKRRTRVFLSRQEAEAFLAEAQRVRKDHGDAGLALSPQMALRFVEAEERLRSVGASVEQAVEFFLEQHRGIRERVSLAKALDRCVLDMELRGVRGNTVGTFVCALRAFGVGRWERELGTITREEIREWVFSGGWVPRTMRGYLQAVSTLLSWAVREGYLARSPLAARGAIRLPKMVRKEPAIFTVEQVERLFSRALSATEMGVVEGQRDGGRMRGETRVYRRLIGYLALATFAGIRPFELLRLEVSAIDLEGGTVTLDASVTKTADRRVVELSENCVAWLRLWRAEYPHAERVAPSSWDRLLKRLRVVAELSPWPHDVLRHCFASYFHALHKDKARLQAQMGHSHGEATLDKHYRAVRGPDGRPVTEQQARCFWGIFPLSVKKTKT